MRPDDRRHHNPGRPRVAEPRVRLSTMVSPQTWEILQTEPPRQRGRLIDRWAEEARTRQK